MCATALQPSLLPSRMRLLPLPSWRRKVATRQKIRDGALRPPTRKHSRTLPDVCVRREEWDLQPWERQPAPDPLFRQGGKCVTFTKRQAQPKEVPWSVWGAALLCDKPAETYRSWTSGSNSPEHLIKARKPVLNLPEPTVHQIK